MIKKYAVFIRKEQIFCISVSILFAVGSVITNGSESFLKSGNVIERTGYGGLDREYELTVEGLSDKPERLTVEVGAREYTETEAKELFASLIEDIPFIICGENESLSSVREDLNLVKSLPEYGVKLTWYPEDAELISYDGEVRNDGIDAAVGTGLRLILSDGKTDSTYEIPVTVLPKLRDERESLIAGFKKMLSDENAKQINSGEFILPEEFEGKSISYKKDADLTPLFIIFLGMVAAVSLAFKERSEASAKLKKREEELTIDYSELVSKLMVFIGAGFGIRGAFEKIVEGYERSGIKRTLYTEMKTSLGELERGVPEGKVYTDFGRRCGLRSYIKLCSILEQNRRNGGKNIRALLSAEMAEAFLERKNIAKRLGEEAGTKLLIPLFIMLMIVMAIVILPAMLAIN